LHYGFFLKLSSLFNHFTVDGAVVVVAAVVSVVCRGVFCVSGGVELWEEEEECRCRGGSLAFYLRIILMS